MEYKTRASLHLPFAHGFVTCLVFFRSVIAVSLRSAGTIWMTEPFAMNVACFCEKVAVNVAAALMSPVVEAEVTSFISPFPVIVHPVK